MFLEPPPGESDIRISDIRNIRNIKNIKNIRNIKMSEYQKYQISEYQKYQKIRKIIIIIKREYYDDDVAVSFFFNTRVFMEVVSPRMEF